MDFKELESLGPPSLATFPKQANPYALDLWMLATSKIDPDSRSAWPDAVRTYRQLCDQAGLLPFTLQSSQDIVDASRAFVLARRSKLVRFLNYTRVLKDIRSRLKTVQVDPAGFGFTLSVKLQINVPDPEWFKSRIKKPYRILRDHRLFKVELDPAITFYIDSRSSMPWSWTTGYSLHCPLKQPVEQDKLSSFVMERIYKPTQSIRPYDGGLRRL